MELFSHVLTGETQVPSDPFHERLNAVQARFAASLESKIKDTYARLPILAGKGADAVDAVAASYRTIHGICGVGAAIGFGRTGHAAKEVEDILVAPYRGGRGLAAEEIASLEQTLERLSAAAAAELARLRCPAKVGG
jgi:hypothetical protein